MFFGGIYRRHCVLGGTQEKEGEATVSPCRDRRSHVTLVCGFNLVSPWRSVPLPIKGEADHFGTPHGEAVLSPFFLRSSLLLPRGPWWMSDVDMACRGVVCRRLVDCHVGAPHVDVASRSRTRPMSM